MKPPPFDYHAPESLDEALELLAKLGDEGKLLAGGQSLVPLMNFRLAWPSALVDLNGVAGLAYVREQDGRLCVGAMTRQRALERSELARTACPLLVEALRFVGHAATRTRGTVGGSVAHADPAAEIPAVLAALDGDVVVAGRAGRRTIAADELFLGHFSTALEPGEVLTEVRFPIASAGRSGGAFVEVARRFGDFALAGVAAAVTLDGSGGCASAGLALCGAAPRPVAVRGVAERLARGAGDDAIDEVAELAAAQAEPQSDVHGDAGYRRDLVRVLAGRALRTALERARGAAA